MKRADFYNELKNRLNAITLINHVHNPVSVRGLKDSDGVIAVLWSGDARSLSVLPSAVQFEQQFLIDIALPWSDNAEQLISDLSTHVIRAVSTRFVGANKQAIGAIETSYPTDGSRRAVISIELNVTYADQIAPN